MKILSLELSNAVVWRRSFGRHGVDLWNSVNDLEQLRSGRRRLRDLDYLRADLGQCRRGNDDCEYHAIGVR
jgi:hypothetical protein